MSKILITGMNKLQCTEDFYLDQHLKVVPSHYSLIRALRDMGHTVEQRIVMIGENLSEYDHVIVYIHNPAGFAGFVYNALYTIYTRPDCILAFDDWQVDSIYSGLLSLKDPEKLFRSYVKDGHKHIPDHIEDYESMMMKALDIIDSKTNRMMISAFAGGDLSKLIEYPSNRIFSYNPNPYHLNRQGVKVIPENKQKVFNFAGLVQGKTARWLKSQKIGDTGWDLKMYGSRKDGQDRVTEDVMVNIYGEQWGILMPGYFHAGSGWWRARPLQSADAGSILIGEFAEMMVLYQDEGAATVKPVDLINLSTNELAEIAAYQKECLYKAHPLDKNVEKEELNTILKAVV
jgi:hypothetical protein